MTIAGIFTIFSGSPQLLRKTANNLFRRNAEGVRGPAKYTAAHAFGVAAKQYFRNMCGEPLFPSADSVSTLREAQALPLTKETLEKVLAELRQHAV